MKIVGLRVHQALLPVVGGPYRTSLIEVDALDSTLVEVVADDGRSGWGETCPLGPVYQPHHALGARAALAQVAPALIGVDLASPRAVAARMDAALTGHGYAKAAIDIAVLDLLGQQLGVPVSTLLGGALVADVPAYFSVAVQDADTDTDVAASRSADQAAQKVEEGYRRIQVKLAGRDLGRDVATVRAVHDAVGDRARLAFDGNRAMTMAHVRQLDQACRDLPFTLEQPCATFEEMQQLRGRLTHPVALDENTEDVGVVLRAIAGGVADSFSFKVTRLGGLTKAALARDLCALRSTPHTCDDAWGGDVIAAACVHLAATVEPRLLEGVWIAQDYIDGHYDEEQPVVAHRGRIAVPQGPGLGVRPDPARLTLLAAYWDQG